MGDDNSAAPQWACIVGLNDVNAMLKRSVERLAARIVHLEVADQLPSWTPEWGVFALPGRELFTSCETCRIKKGRGVSRQCLWRFLNVC